LPLNKHGTLTTSSHYDIIIAGAGPAGTGCALALKNSGLKVLVVDKNKFPRDKICGDAIPNTVPKALRMLDERYLHELRAFPEKVIIDSCKVVAPSGKEVTLQFKLEGYASTRVAFDSFMVELAKRESGATFITGTGVKDVEQHGELMSVTTENNDIYSCSMIIGCDGAQSVVNKKLTATKVDHRHYIGAVRCYYRNVSGTSPNTMEIHLVKGFMPGYFWIFPLPDNTFNIGYGMVSEAISRKKINLRKSLTRIIQENKTMQERFANATPLEEPIGYGLPTGSRKVTLSGERFLLAGDAASLIDPATGEGIGNAMISGILAGKQAIKCFEQQQFDALFMQQYDRSIHDKFYDEMRNKYLMQRMVGEKAWLADMAIGLAAGVPWIKEKLQKLF
jgi:geranylgeranyl reductase family protein